MSPLTALIAGSGALPALLVAERPDLLVTALDGFLPQGLQAKIIFRVERLVPFMRALEDLGVQEVIFAGSVRRPRLDPSLFDAQTAQIVPQLVAAMQGGDDTILREVVAIFENFGFVVKGLKDVAPAFLPSAAVLVGEVNARDQADSVRAALIVDAMGAVDVGQGAVVAGGMCLAVESLPGTDAMLQFVAQFAPHPNSEARVGLLYKAPKLTQDRRIDLPALGPQTVINAANAGLAGICFEAGGVILIERDALLAKAAELGLFIWARKK